MSDLWLTGSHVLLFFVGQEGENIVVVAVEFLGRQRRSDRLFLEPEGQFSGIEVFNRQRKVDPTNGLCSGVVVLVVACEHQAPQTLGCAHQTGHALVLDFPGLFIMKTVNVKPRTGDDFEILFEARKHRIPRLENGFHASVLVKAMNRTVIKAKDRP